MRPTQRSLVVLVSAVQILCPPTSSAVQAVTQPDASYQLYTDARAREVEARAAHERARAGLQRAEEAASAAAEVELRLRGQQKAELDRVEQEIIAAFDRLVAASRRPEKLLLELDILEQWYELYQPVIGNLTERSFRPIEVELGGLAKQGLIEPGERHFRAYADLRTRIAAVQARLRQSQAESERQKAAIRGELARLDARRNLVLARLARPTSAGDRSGDAWLAAASEAAVVGQKRAEAEERVLKAYLELSRSAEQMRPPVLLAVTASVSPARTVYQADWRRGDGSAANEPDREDRRRLLRQKRHEVINIIEDVQAVRRAWTAGRLEAAERMAVRSRMLEAWTQRYADDLEMQWGANLGFEIGLTLAEIALTGGAATLERKSAEAVEQAVAAAGKAEASPLAIALARSYRMRGDALSDQLRRASEQAAFDLTKEIDEAAKILMRQDIDPRIAQRQAAAMFQPAIEQINKLHELRSLANRAVAEDGMLKNELARFAGPGRSLDLSTIRLGGLGISPALSDVRSGLTEELITKVPLTLPTVIRFAQNPSAMGAKPDEEFSGVAREFEVNSWADVALGEAMELGVSVLVNSIKDRPASAAADALSRWGRVRAFAGSVAEANRKNARGYGLAIVSGAIKVWAANQTDKVVNADVQAIAELMGELAFLYRQYYIQLQMDRMLHGVLTSLSQNYAAIGQAILELDAGYVLRQATPPDASAPAEGDLRLELSFSAPLLAAPKARLGQLEVGLDEIAGSNGLRWQGTVPVSSLGEGNHALSVSIPTEASPFGSLDSDPSTGAVRRPGSTGWVGFERGPDTNHTIRLTVETARRTESPWDRPDPNSPWDKAGFGETVSSGPRATPQPDDAPYFGRWRARINRAGGPPVFLDLVFYSGCAGAVSDVSLGYIDELSFENGRLRGRTLDAFAFDHPWFEGFDVAIAGDAARGEWLSTGFSDRAASEWRRVAPRVRDVSVQSRDGQHLTLAVRGEDLPLAGRGSARGCGEARSESAGISVIAARREGDVLLLTVRIEPGVADGTKHLVLNGFRVPWEWRGP